MKKTRIPARTCIACRQTKDKTDLIRFVKTPSGIIIDKTGKCEGRGAYVCKSYDCLKKAEKSKALNRAFKMEVSQDAIELALKEYESKN